MRTKNIDDLLWYFSKFNFNSSLSLNNDEVLSKNWFFYKNKFKVIWEEFDWIATKFSLKNSQLGCIPNTPEFLLIFLRCLYTLVRTYLTHFTLVHRTKYLFSVFHPQPDSNWNNFYTFPVYLMIIKHITMK